MEKNNFFKTVDFFLIHFFPPNAYSIFVIETDCKPYYALFFVSLLFLLAGFAVLSRTHAAAFPEALGEVAVGRKARGMGYVCDT